MRLSRGCASLLSLLLGAWLLTACSERAPHSATDPALRFSSSSPVLVECPTDVTQTASATIDPGGGIVEVAGSRIELPIGAVLLPTEITLTVPAGKFMEIDVQANGLESFSFELPVIIVVGYGRCTRSNIDKEALYVWQIDPATKALLESMGGADDKTARTLTFSTDHLSGYALAN